MKVDSESRSSEFKDSSYLENKSFNLERDWRDGRTIWFQSSYRGLNLPGLVTLALQVMGGNLGIVFTFWWMLPPPGFPFHDIHSRRDEMRPKQDPSRRRSLLGQRLHLETLQDRLFIHARSVSHAHANHGSRHVDVTLGSELGSAFHLHFREDIEQ